MSKFYLFLVLSFYFYTKTNCINTATWVVNIVYTQSLNYIVFCCCNAMTGRLLKHMYNCCVLPAAAAMSTTTVRRHSRDTVVTQSRRQLIVDALRSVLSQALGCGLRDLWIYEALRRDTSTEMTLVHTHICDMYSA